MSTAQRLPAVPLMEPGDRLTQAEFHRRYECYPDDKKFELIGGIVYMASPARWPHGLYISELNFALGLYKSATPGVELGNDATTILGDKSEPQPDLALRIFEEFGGRSIVNVMKYVAGPPELLAEIAYSSLEINMHQKKEDYQKAGVLEYLVLCVDEQELHWFHFKSHRMLKPNRQGIYRSRVFPGLWIDGPALLARDSARLIEVIQQGLANPEHARFVKRLQAAHSRRSRK